MVKICFKIEYLAWVNLALKHRVHQLWQIFTNGGRTPSHTYIAEEGARSINLHVMRHADATHNCARTSDGKGCLVGLSCPDAF